MRFKLLYLSCLSLLLAQPSPASAQLIPDTTLGNENSIVNQINNLRQDINGGATRGTNLFHSFQEFNVNSGQSVFFNAPGISNIFTRVTGSNVSNIFGTLGVNGNANLFLINPNGIIFSQGARLNLNGGFTATTATNLSLGPGLEFSAINPQPLANNITVNFPISFGFGNPNQPINTGTITVQGTGQNLQPQIPGQLITGRNTTQSLQVNPGQNLNLIGGNINLNGGSIASVGGQINLAAIARGTVLAEANGQLNLESVLSFENVRLTNGSSIDLSSSPAVPNLGSGSVTIQGATVELLDNSVILNQNQSIESAGNIDVIATQNFSAIGLNNGSLRSGIYSETGGLNSGEGGNISIRSPNIILQNAAIAANTYSAAEGGQISLTTNNIQIAADSTISTLTTGTGSGGEINLEPISGNQIAVSDINLITATSQGLGEPGEISVDGTIVQGRIFITPEVPPIETIEQIQIQPRQQQVDEIQPVVRVREQEDFIVSLLTRQSYSEYIDNINRSCRPAGESEDNSKFGIRNVFPAQKFLEEGGSWQFDIFITTDERARSQENWNEAIVPNAIIADNNGKTYLGLICASRKQE